MAEEKTNVMRILDQKGCLTLHTTTPTPTARWTGQRGRPPDRDPASVCKTLVTQGPAASTTSLSSPYSARWI